jgi:hypothetical protein
MGSLLLAAGTAGIYYLLLSSLRKLFNTLLKGMRHSLPNSRIMIHQPSGGVQV